MAPNREHGRAVPVSAVPLPELAFDLAEGAASSLPAGRTETPVNVLPELVCERQGVTPGLVLQLSLHLRSQAGPGEVALDLFRLFVAVNQLDASFRGTGLIPDDAQCEALAGGRMRVVLRPREPDGAAGRLARLAEAINTAANPPALAQQPPYRSIERWEAKVLPSAA